MMKRSDFLKKTLIASGTLLSPSILSSQAAMPELENNKTFNLNYGPHHGQFENHAGKNILDQIRFAHDHGFRSIEDNGLVRRDQSEQTKIGELLASLGMTMGVFVLNKGGNGENTLTAGKQEHIDIFLKGCKEAIELSKRSGGIHTTVVPGNFERNLPMDMQTSHVIEALKRGAEILEPHGIIMVLEALSDTPDLFLRTSTQTYLISKSVNSPSCKILYDIYHMQKNEGHLIHNINLCWDEIAYFQAGDNPGRKEPTTGEINYKNVFKHMYSKGYRGVVGMEHGKSTGGKEGEVKLIAAYREVDDFLT